MPRLGEKYDVEIETVSKLKAEYLSDEYFVLDLPVAPAIMVGDEIVIEGHDIDDNSVEEIVCRHLGLPKPEQKNKENKGVMISFFSRLGKNMTKKIMLLLMPSTDNQKSSNTVLVLAASLLPWLV